MISQKRRLNRLIGPKIYLLVKLQNTLYQGPDDLHVHISLIYHLPVRMIQSKKKKRSQTQLLLMVTIMTAFKDQI